MSCDDGHQFLVNFHEFTECACKSEVCGASYDVSNVKVTNSGGSEVIDKRSLFDDLDNMDADAKARHRRNLLNELAMMHANKKKR